MKLRFEDHGRLCVVQVDGECVGESAESLRRACVERFTGGAKDVILDVSKTSLIDSAVAPLDAAWSQAPILVVSRRPSSKSPRS